jgi:glutaminase
VTTVDGQHFSIGDADRQFCIQSCSKPLSYLVALNEFGEEYVHSSVGTEPSGRAFNEMTLKKKPTKDDPDHAIPHNPMINAGAIMSVSMVYPDLNRAKRLEKILDFWRDLSSGAAASDIDPVGYDDATYRSESATADRNWCLGFMMKECHAWPPCFTGLKDTLELYFQICSILNTGRGMATMAATLANGGLNPMSGVRVVAPQHVRCALPLMLTSGMYDYSGQWAYDVGVPAKSGVGGCVFLVIPNVCGISIWSPRLDGNGNSVRGVAVATELVKHLAIHNFEVFSGLSRKKIDLTMRKNAALCAEIGDVLFAASQGDTQALSSAIHAGTNVYAGDYDQRTSLHLAAAEGHEEALRLLVDSIPSSVNKTAVLCALDRWGGTPLDDAVTGNHQSCVDVLKAAGALPGANNVSGGSGGGGDDGSASEVVVSADAPRMLFAAAENDVDELIKLSASGEDLTTGDYDKRTACHLAASNGHLDALKYIVVQAGESVLQAKDRFGHTPQDDAARNGHVDCLGFMRPNKKKRK